MRRLTALTLAIALTLAACVGSTLQEQAVRPSTVTTATTSSVAPTTPSHVPVWVAVKYRPSPIDVAAPEFVSLGSTDSSLVATAFYDAGNEYAIIVLNGTAYHYCGLPSGMWSAFASADSLGRYYQAQIKGRFDCRTGIVPEY